MKIFLLSDVNSIHTLKWANSLSNLGHSVFVYGLNPLFRTDYYPNVKIFTASIPQSRAFASSTSLSKLSYLKYISEIKALLNLYHPDILHAHYASSYGLLGALTNFHPFIVSVWGTDIFNFPKSFAGRTVIKYVLSKADQILSTSNVMAKEI